MTAAGRRWRGPATHAITWKVERRIDARPDSPWECSCGKSGDGVNEPAERHLTPTAEAAFRRLDVPHAYATLATTDVPRGHRASLSVLFMHPAWPQLRHYAVAGYDWAGTLKARMDWQQVAAALDAGEITGDEYELLLIRIAASLAGAGQVNLAQVAELPWHGEYEQAYRRVREALMGLLPAEEDR